MQHSDIFNLLNEIDIQAELANLLKQPRMTQAKLEVLSGVSQGMISRISRGITRDPNWKTMKKLLPFLFANHLGLEFPKNSHFPPMPEPKASVKKINYIQDT